MNVQHDKSLIGYGSQELVEHGYGCIAADVLRLEFLYNLDREHEQVSSRQRNRIMKSVMDAIGDRFSCYQYNVPRDAKYDSPDWALFFWCRPATKDEDVFGDGRDYSYFTLTINPLYAPEKRQEICDQVIQLLNMKYAGLSNLYFTVQYATLLDNRRITDDAARLAPALNGRKWTYHGQDGKLVYTQRGLSFMRKYAKRKGYLLDATDILQIAWEEEAAA